ncbi:hypothetical protein AbraIFM66950_009551 [Aspergillus brasiliensis]|nr:hypothetical protein AbraIFM66950_009551 [Aspergillus brasiliensis]
MKERLKRVEQLLLERQGPLQGSNPGDVDSLVITPQPESKAVLRNVNHEEWDNLESIAASPQTEELKDPKSEHKSALSQAPSAIGYPIKPSQVFSETRKFEIDQQLPPVDTARALLEHYVQGIDYLGRVVHAPSARSLLENVYSQLSQSTSPPAESIIFLLAIFASASFYLECGQLHLSSDGLHLHAGQSHRWKETTLQHMLQMDQLFSCSMMSLQSALIVLVLLWDSEGQSKRFHTLKSLAYAKAIQMGMHNVDAGPSDVGRDLLEQEMKRRLWWHFTCTDWLIGSAPGPQQGIYMISPHHMTVNYPVNIEDEDLTEEGIHRHPKPDRHPTSMSFFLCRLKFAQLCRESMDAIQHAQTTQPSQPIYPLILEISDKYMSFLKELPWFFRLEGEEEDETKRADLAKKQPYISHQRAVLLYGIYSRLGRLHRPFVTKGITDPGFAASYNIGIECAERLLRIRRMTAVHGSQLLDIFGRSQSVDQHTFNAMLLLTIDVMAHPNSPDSERRRADVIEICHILQDKHVKLGHPASGISRAVQMLLDIVRNSNRPHIKDKDRIDSTGQVGSNTAQSMDSLVVPDQCTMASEASYQMAWIDEFLSISDDQDMDTLFDELWGSYSETSIPSREGFLNWEGL